LRKIGTLAVLCLLLSACLPKSIPNSPPQADMVGTSVAAALTAIPPQPSYTPYPTQTPYPTLDLGGMFCEYEFCIGHPDGVPLFDLEAVNDYTSNRSSTRQGMLITFAENLYIFLAWSAMVGDYSPETMLAYTLQNDLPNDVRMTVDINGYPVTYVLLKSTPSNMVPYGLAAAWVCGDRQFGWKAYVSQDGQALEFLRQAMSRFTCKGR
jgi:hypothetical protein